MKINKKEIQKRVLLNGKKLALSKFNWDEKTNTFSSNQGNLVVDFSNINHSTINTWSNSTINAGYNSTIDAGSNSTINAGSYSTIKAEYDSTIKAGFDSTIKAGSHSTIKAGSHSTINTRSYSTITVGENCVIINRDYFQVIQEVGKIQTYPNSKGFIKYNEEKQAWFDENNIESIIKDGILSRIVSKKTVKDIEILTVNNQLEDSNYFEEKESYLAIQGEFSAHGESVKSAIKDLKFKILQDKVKKEPIYMDTIITPVSYRMITGACWSGMKRFIDKFNIEHTGTLKEKNLHFEITVEKLLPLLKKDGSYGITKFESLITK